MEHAGFPSDETLAAFLDGRLDPETRRRVIEHMTTCDECYSVVASGGEERNLLKPDELSFHRRLQTPFRRFPLSLLGTAAAAVIVILLIPAWHRIARFEAMRELRE